MTKPWLETAGYYIRANLIPQASSDPASTVADWLGGSGLLVAAIGLGVTILAMWGLIKQWTERYSPSPAAVVVLQLLILFHVLLVCVLHRAYGFSWFAAAMVAWCSLLVSALATSALWGLLLDWKTGRSRTKVSKLKLRQDWLKAQTELAEKRLASLVSGLGSAKAANQGAQTSFAGLEEEVDALVDTNPALLVAHRSKIASKCACLGPNELIQRRQRIEAELTDLRQRIEACQDTGKQRGQINALEHTAEACHRELEKSLVRDPRNLAAKAHVLQKGLRLAEDESQPSVRWRGKVEGIVHEQARLARERKAALSALHEQEDCLKALKTAHQFRELELLVIRLAQVRMPASRAGRRIRAAEKAIADTQAQLDQLRPELNRTNEQIQQVKRPRAKRLLK